MKYIPKILELKGIEGIDRKIPQFMQVRKFKKKISLYFNKFFFYFQVRKGIYQELSPDVVMSFIYLNKNDDTIIRITGDRTPLTKFEQNPQYQKLYEEAHIEVHI